MADINNATPNAILQGIRDGSTQQLPVENPSIAQAYPLIWTLAERGPEEAFVSGGTQANQLFGTTTFNLNGEYTTHQTLVANVAFAAGTGALIKRIKPAAAKTAEINLYAEIVAATEAADLVTKAYFRKDVKPDTTFDFAGIAKDYRVGSDDNSLEATEGSSTLFKLLEVKAESFGSYYNRFAIQLTPRANPGGSVADVQLSEEIGHYVYTLTVFAISDRTGEKQLLSSNLGDTSAQCVLADGVTHPSYGTPLSLDRVLSEHYDIFSEVTVYYSAIQEYQSRLADGYETTDTDGALITVPGSGGSPSMVNLFSEVTLVGSQADSYRIQPDAVNPATGLQFVGGNDGLIRAGDVYEEKLVTQTQKAIFNNLTLEFAVQADCDSLSLGTSKYVMDRAYYTFRDVVDSGFTAETKAKLALFAGLRKDVHVWGTTFEFLSDITLTDHIPAELDPNTVSTLTEQWAAEGYNTSEIQTKLRDMQYAQSPKDLTKYNPKLITKVLTIGQESAVTAIVSEAFRLQSESTEFGTAATRFALMQQSGELKSSPYPYRAPLILEVFAKCARYMGGASGKFKNGSSPDVSPNNQLSMFKVDTVNARSRPSTIYTKDYAKGVMWAQTYDRERLFVPVTRSIYDNDTSVLVSLITTKACATLEVIADSVWRDLVGNTTLTDEQFLERSDELIAERVEGLFDNRFIIEPDTYYTGNDIARGFTWSTNIDIYANNTRTVARYAITARRRSDYTGER